MHLPKPAGPLSASLMTYLRKGGPTPRRLGGARQQDPLHDRDLQLSLYVAYELHYRGFEDCDAECEWDPTVLTLRGQLEREFLGAVRDLVGPPRDSDPEVVAARLFEMAEADESPSLAEHLGPLGTLAEFREFVIHRSAYQLKEADPHSWAIPRLDGVAKAALLEVQFDEYGSGNAERIHARLFADSMRALGLDASYGAYLNRLPAETLATVNLMSLFGLHRRWRGAIVGHLAMFEITSAGPNRLYARGLRRLGVETATEFFDEHVEADSIHENIAAYDLAQGLALSDPALGGDILFGARALLALDGIWAGRVLEAWSRGESSLMPAASDSVAA
jgi:hypothetical protein